MHIRVNGVQREIRPDTTLRQLQRQVAPHTDIAIYQGFQTDQDLPLCEGDTVTFIRRGSMPSSTEFEEMLFARHTPQVHEKIKGATVGIAGLGGLGSNIAEMLARTGVGRLVLADFDLVEPSNLNRQNYTVRHLGMPKVEATKLHLSEVNPYLKIAVHFIRVDESNLARIFEGCDVVCEAFDDPAQKAMLVSGLLEQLPDVAVVASSGMAGYASANQIKTSKQFQNLYLCGDGETDARPGCGLMAPRVGVCAGHQANMVLRLLLGECQP